MKQNHLKFALFVALLFLPFIAVVFSLISIRNAVFFEQKVEWVAGNKAVYTIPENKFNQYEFRLESTESKWEPEVSARWTLYADNQEILAQSPAEGTQWIMTRPFLTYSAVEGKRPKSLEFEFMNSNTENHPIYLKISQDRGALLQKSERLFIVLLALSLGLALVIWKPLFRVPSKTDFVR